MRISSLTLEHFRCFHGITTIDLSADVVAIYGRNGVGKTAVFDAIELGLLGQIGRFGDSYDQFGYLANVTERKPPRVRIEFANAEPDYVTVSVPHVGGASTIEGSKSWASHRDFLYDFLVSENYVPARREVDALRALFRASRLLSQSSIQTFIDCEPDERSKTLTLLTGAANLQRYFEKLEDVHKLADRRVEQTKFEIEKLALETIPFKQALTAAEKRRELLISELDSELVSAQAVVDALRVAGTEVVLQETDYEVFVAAAKAYCRESRVRLSQRNRLLSELEAIAKGHPERSQQKIDLTKTIEELRKELRKIDLQETDLISATAVSRRLISRLNENLDELRRSDSALMELPTLQSTLRHREKELTETTSKQEKHKNELDKCKSQLETLPPKLFTEEVEIQNSQAHIPDLRDKLSAYDRLRAELTRFVSDVDNLSRLNARQVESTEQRNALIRDLLLLSERKRATEGAVKAIAAERSSLNASVLHKKQLIAQLRKFAADEKCPMCGHRHDSAKDLADAIEVQLADTPAEVLRLADRIENANAEAQLVTDNVRAAEEQLAAYGKELSDLIETIGTTSARIRERELQASRLNCRMDPSSIDSMNRQTQEELEGWEKRFQGASDHRVEILRQLESLKLTRRNLESENSDEEKMIREAGASIQTTRNRIAELGLFDAINWSEAMINEQRSLVGEKLESAQKTKDESTVELSQFEQRLDLIRQDRNEKQGNLRELETRLGKIIAEIEEALQLCRQLKVSDANLYESVLAEREELNNRLNAITVAEDLIERYISSKRIEQLNTEVESSTQQLVETQNKISLEVSSLTQLDNAKAYVETWSKMVKEAASTIVENEIRAHQPEVVRLFKTMIPSPYLFDDLLMYRTEEGLTLGLKYRDQVRDPGEPKLFLSSAQANVLALAIFLSFACTQRWSNLESIFLDDPVQHLDDLDAVSFLDNLRAVALGRYGPKKQVILSTCDQNLYLLMIRKFRLIKADGLKFCGISLLERGTNAPEVIYDIGGPSSAGLAYAS